MTCPLRAEYESAYSEAQERLASVIWQSMKRGPDGAPDWEAREWTRPGGWAWHRGNECVSFDPREWNKP